MLGTSLDLIIIGQKMLIMAGILLVMVLFAFIARRYRKYLKHFIAFAILVNIVYIIWRLFFTIPTMNFIALIFGVLLFLAELFALIQTTTHRLMFLKDYEPEIKTLSDLKEIPNVDILIATYNEPITILKNTVAAATSQQYPKEKFKVYICDDGRREEVRQLAETYGAVWSVRDEHIHAKAGNLNHCLKHYASAEFFVVLDADMIPKSTFLERTMGYFSDPSMSLVQAPQVFYNPDPFQNNLQLYDAIPNEQDFFMREVLTRRNLFNAVLNVGSNAVFRRSAIEEIGMIPVGTITEDMATSMLLQAKGYKTLFVNENLAMGLSPDSFSDYIVQRDRWCRGNIQVMKKWNPLKLPGLSFMQRLIYFDGVLYWFFGLQKFIYFIGPILFLLTGIPVLYVDVFTMLLFFTPTYYISVLVFTLFNHKSRTYSWAHIYETALAPYLSISALSELFFSRKLKFSVTPKGSIQNKSYFSLWAAMPHIVISILSIMALAAGLSKMLTDVNYMVPVYLVNIFWLLYNLLGAITAILVNFERKRYRTSERFMLHESVGFRLQEGNEIQAALIDISLAGCAILLKDPLEDADTHIGEQVSIVMSNGGLSVTGKILRSRSWGKKIIILFDDMPSAVYTRLINYIFDRQQSGYGSFDPGREDFSATFREIISKWWKMVRTN